MRFARQPIRATHSGNGNFRCKQGNTEEIDVKSSVKFNFELLMAISAISVSGSYSYVGAILIKDQRKCKV